jgi:RNA polymerase-binding transcription factor
MVLKKNEIEAFKNQLIKLRSEYLSQFQVTKNVVKEQEDPKGYSQHSADEGSDDFEKSLNLELSSKEQEVIRQIDRALEKIDEGTYGICDVTNEEIPLKRLKAIPYATMTVKAQEELENNRR